MVLGSGSIRRATVKILFWTPKMFSAITQNFTQKEVFPPKGADGIANSVHSVSHQGLPCLPQLAEN